LNIGGGLKTLFSSAGHLLLVSPTNENVEKEMRTTFPCNKRKASENQGQMSKRHQFAATGKKKKKDQKSLFSVF
jgi:hypothetical protein